jgi:streptogramin lyase
MLMKKILYSCFIFSLLLNISCKKEEQVVALNPAISSIFPIQGPAKTVVTITGKRFGDKIEGLVVKFSGINATIISASDTLITVEAPEDGGTGNISVTANGRLSKGPVFSYGAKEIDYLVETYAGAAAGNVVGDLSTARFNTMEGLIFDSKGNLLVADRGNNQIKKITPAGQVSIVAGTGVSGLVDGPALSARFKTPYKIGVDKHDNIWVADTGNNSVRRIDAVTGMVTTIAGTTSAGFLDGPGTSARFNGPIAIAVDNEMNVYVADNNNHSIRKIDPSGFVSTIAGTGATGYKDGVWPTVQFGNPSGVAIDLDGNLVIADRKNHRIRKLNTKTGVVTTIAGNGTKASIDGIGLKSSFSEPFGISVDHNGNFCIADLTSHTVRIMRLDGTVVSVGGSGTSGLVNGDHTSAKFSQPTDAVMDKNGNIFVADLSNDVIRKISPKK